MSDSSQTDSHSEQPEQQYERSSIKKITTKNSFISNNELETPQKLNLSHSNFQTINETKNYTIELSTCKNLARESISLTSVDGDQQETEGIFKNFKKSVFNSIKAE